MTDQSITQGEFQRFQDQLISLKEAKYKSEEKCEMLYRNLKQSEIKCANLERELLKANEFKSKIRSGKDLEMLLEDNQVLRDRMSATEANFKLQNQILRTECETLLSENERLKCQIETCKGPLSLLGGDFEVTDSNGERDKIRSLQFEVAKLMEEKRKSVEENGELVRSGEVARGVERELAVRVDSLLNEKSKLVMENERLRGLLEKERGCYVEERRIEREKWEEEVKKMVLERDKALLDAEKLVKDHVEETEVKRREFERDLNRNRDLIEAEFLRKLSEAKEKWENEENDYKKAVENWQLRLEENVREWSEKLEEREKIYGVEIAGIEVSHSVIVSSLETEIGQLKESLQFAEEELKVYGKKNQKLLKDVKKQLEKEMKLSQDMETKLEVQSHESQNSQTKVSDFLGGSSHLYSTDDQSSLHSSSNNGILCDGGQWSSPSIAVTDDELRTLLDRLTNVQNEYCEFKRKIDVLKQEKSQLIETVKRQENIILNYIKNRGKGDSCDTSPDNFRKKQSTSEALTLNGLMSSPVHSKTSLGSLLTKVKETLQSITPQDILPLSGDKFSYRVTDVDVKQLQRVCEELMMRCLNLETDLQSAVDLNVKLIAKLETQDSNMKS